MKKLLIAIAAAFGLSSADMMSDSMAAHNNERGAHGIPSLSWSNSLAQTAQAYAEVMASTGTTSHSKGRVNVGENLAWGRGSSVDTNYLAGLWLNEKEFYIPGRDFPDCSTTGSWHDVAHYTQLMWEQTTEVGCGLAKASSGMNYYVCHYSPQGNMNGEPVYTEGAPAGNTQSQTAPVDTTSAATTPDTAAPVDTTSANTQPTASSSQDDQFVSDSLAAHNNARNAHGVPSLTWSDSLAQTAQAYSSVMAATGSTSHSKGRVNVGENLAWGSGSYSLTPSLAARWVNEKQYFIAGQDFPDCSTTGSWHDVAHYTQLMWRKTTQVGCGKSTSSSGMSYYVCHYSPQGNIDGQPVY